MHCCIRIVALSGALKASAEHVSILEYCGRGRLPPEALDPAASSAAASAAAAAVAAAQAAWERLFGELAAAVERQPGAMREVNSCSSLWRCAVRLIHWDEQPSCRDTLVLILSASTGCPPLPTPLLHSETIIDAVALGARSGT